MRDQHDCHAAKSLVAKLEGGEEAAAGSETYLSKAHLLDLLFLMTACWLLASLGLTLGQTAYPGHGVVAAFGVSHAASVSRDPVRSDGRLEGLLLAGTP